MQNIMTASERKSHLTNDAFFRNEQQNMHYELGNSNKNILKKPVTGNGRWLKMHTGRVFKYIFLKNLLCYIKQNKDVVYVTMFVHFRF